MHRKARLITIAPSSYTQTQGVSILSSFSSQAKLKEVNSNAQVDRGGDSHVFADVEELALVHVCERSQHGANPRVL